MLVNKPEKNGHTKRAVFMLIALSLLPILSFQACLGIQTHVNGLEPQARYIEDKNFETLGPAKGQSSSFNLLWLFPVTPPVDYNEAIDFAISKKGGDNLIEVYSWHERQYWMVGTVDILHVKGKVIKYK